MKNGLTTAYKWIKKHYITIGFIIVTLISVLVRIKFIKFISDDMEIHLLEWYYTLKENGGLLGLGINIGDYNMPYITILALLTYLPISPIISIKMVSIIFDYVLAISCAKLVKEILKNKSIRYKEIYELMTYCIVIMLPTVIINGSLWGQCDSIYSSFVILSLLYLIKHKYTKSFILLGIAFAFKLQFILALPIYILIYVRERKFPIYNFIIIPLVNVIMCVPAILFGNSIKNCISVYFNQAQEYSNYISLNYPGIYNWICKIQNPTNVLDVPYSWLPKTMIIITGMIFFIGMIYVILKKVKFDEKLIIETVLCSIMIMTFLLPFMHDRYAYIADVLSIVYLAINGRCKLYAAVGINLCSLYTYNVFLFQISFIDIRYVTLLNLIIIILLIKSWIKNTMNKQIQCNEQ